MKLYRPAYCGPVRAALAYDIATAFAISCDSGADGQVERARDNASMALRKLGELIALLHEKNVLTDADVMRFLSGFETRAD